MNGDTIQSTESVSSLIYIWWKSYIGKKVKQSNQKVIVIKWNFKYLDEEIFINPLSNLIKIMRQVFGHYPKKSAELHWTTFNRKNLDSRRSDLFSINSYWWLT